MGQARHISYGDVRRRVGLTVFAALPLFFLFASVGEVERGLIGSFLAYIAATAMQLGWRHRRQIWFWCVAATMIAAALVQLFAIDWPKLDSGRGLASGYTAAAVNALVWMALFKLAPLLASAAREEAPVRCRVCGLPMETGMVRCSHCGAWSPTPVPTGPLAITLLPVVLVVAVTIVMW